MLVIGICGASGSGKTTLSQELKASLKEENCSATIINQDTYYYDFPEKVLRKEHSLTTTNQQYSTTTHFMRM